MADYQINLIMNIPQKNKNKIFLEKQLKANRNNMISKRIFIIALILYLNIQASISDEQFITLKIKKGYNQIINAGFINYLSEVYINGQNQTNFCVSYNFTENENTVKLLFNSQITHLNQMFKDCNNIIEIDFTNFDVSNIEKLSETFRYCKQLKSLDLSNWDVTKVTKIDHLFEGCNSLVSLKLPNFENSNLVSMKNVFRGCQKLTSLHISKIDTSKVTTMEYMFY